MPSQHPPSLAPSRADLLAELGLVESQPEPAVQDVVLVAAQAAQAPLAMLGLVSGERVWLKARVGFPSSEVPAPDSVFVRVTESAESSMVITDMTQDVALARHALVMNPWAMRRVAAVPVRSRPEGHVLAVLAVFHPEPGPWPLGTVASLQALGRQVEERFAQRRAQRGHDAALHQAIHAGIRAAVEGDDAGLWEWDVPQNRVVVSEACRRLLGLPSGDDDAYRGWQAGVHPDDLPSVRAALAQLSQPGQDTFRAEYRFRRPDGGEMWLVDRGRVVARDGAGGAVHVAGILMDITQRRRTEAALVESEQRFRYVADQAPVLLWVSEASGACTFFNAAWLRFTGRTMDQELGEGWAESLHADDRAGCLATYREALAERVPFHSEYRLRRHDGVYRTILVAVAPRWDEEGRFTGFIGSCSDVEDMTQALARQRDSEARLLEAQDIAQVGHWRLDLRDGSVSCSPQVYRLLGIDPLVGEVTFADVVARVHPHDLEDWQSYMEVLRATGGPAEIEHRVVHPDGSTRQVAGRGRAELGSEGRPVVMYGTMQDITERSLMAQESQRLIDIIERLPDFVAVASVEGQVLYANDALRTRCLADGGVINGLGAIADYHPADMALTLVTDILPDVDRLGVWTGTTTFRDAAGQPFRCLQTVMAHRDRGGVLTHYSTIARDITEQTRNEEELRAAKEQAETSARAKGDFLAIMSHELRTPLNGAIGMLSLLAGGALSADQRDQVETARSCNRTLLGIIDDILDFSRLDAGAIHLASRPFRPRDLVREIVATHGAKAVAAGLRLISDVQPSVPERVLGDVQRVRQVVGNLVANAIKFTQVGAVTVRVGAGPLGLRVAVMDTGIGMDDATQRRLFRPFSQADGSMTRRFGGTGLGLVISHQIVELMQGTISVVSAPGRGSVFTVDLPLPLAQPPALPTLVLIDPIVPRRTLQVRHLRSLGATVTTADFGAAVPPGLIVARVSDDTVDALVDLRTAGRQVLIQVDAGETAPPGFRVLAANLHDEALLQALLAACPEDIVPP